MTSRASEGLRDRGAVGTGVLFAAVAVVAAAAAASAGCRAGPHDGNAGAGCNGDGDCDDGLSCELGFPDGYCTASCSGGTPCPDRTLCVNLSGLELCLRACDDGRDCRADYRCQAGVCDFPCTADADCLGGWRCDADGSCVPDQIDCTSAPAPTGCPCDTDAACAGGDCLPDTLGAVCTAPCADEDDCPVGLTCRLVAASDGMGGMLYSPRCLLENAAGAPAGAGCATEDDCRAGFCFAEHCRDLCTECPAGAECRTVGYQVGTTLLPAGLCFPAGPDDPIELGAFDTATPTATVDDVPFTLPPGTRSFAIFAETPDGDTSCPYPTRLVDPTGTVFWNGASPGLVHPESRRGIFSLIVPDGDPTPPLAGGTWTLSIGTFSCTTLWSTGALSPFPGAVSRVVVYPSSTLGGTLDVNVHLTPATGVTAAAAGGALWLTLMMNQFWGAYAAAGVEMGVVTYFDAPATYDTIDTNLDEACAAVSLPAPSGGPAVNVVLVGDFTDGNIGLSTGLPGAFMDVATPISCVGVAAFPFDGAYTGNTVAHEVGHFFGLRHTTEFGGATCALDYCYDAISDTPECADASSLGACPDWTNLMFPWNDAQVMTFSAGQAVVLSGAPTLR